MSDEKYYMFVNGENKGPFSKEALIAEGLTPDTMVWRSDLPNWVEARSVPELMEILQYGNPGNSYSGSSNYGQNVSKESYGSQQYGGQQYGGSSYGGGQQYGGSSYRSGQQYPPQQPNFGEYPVGYKNWMTWAVVATIAGACFGGLILGIIAIVFSSQANSAAKQGNMYEADSKNSIAKIMTIITLVLDGIGILAFIGYIIFYIFIASVSSSYYYYY